MAFWLPLFQALAGSLISTALTKTQNGPQLTDLTVQKSAYGEMLPRIYGEKVRLAGNVIDASDLIEQKHRRGGYGKRTIGGGERFFGLGRQNYYTYSVDLVIAIAEGPVPYNALQRIFANGKVIFDRNAPNTDPDHYGFDASGEYWNKANKSAPLFESLRFYRGDTTQTVNSVVAELHPGENIAYRHTVYVVIEGFQLQDFGNGVPNLEFELNTGIERLGAVVASIASHADVDVYDNDLNQTLPGYVLNQDGSAWAAIEPLSAAYAFDMIEQPDRFAAVPRGRYMRAVIPGTEFGAASADAGARSRKNAEILDPNDWPDEVNITYFALSRDGLTNTQRAFRNAGYSSNKLNVNLPVYLADDFARTVAFRTLYEALAAVKTSSWTLPETYRWLNAGDTIGIEVGGNIEPFRIANKTRSPNLIIEIETVITDPLAYTSDIPAAAGNFPDQEIEAPGATTMLLIDSPITDTGDDDTGMYVAVTGANRGWRGVDIYRSISAGSPYAYELAAGTTVSSVIGDALTTLPSGATDVWDRINTLTVEMITDEALTTESETDVLVSGLNLAWVGGADGQDGEFIHFATATQGSPGVYVLSNLLRGRFGTEHLVGSHTSGEKVVLFLNDAFGRMDFGAADWNISRRYKPVSVMTDLDMTAPQDFTNTGEGKKPLSPVHLRGTRDGSNNITIEWVRRTRYSTPQLGGGAAPLGEDLEQYEVDIMNGSTVLRTLTSSTPSVVYTAAMQTTDGHTLGALQAVRVYQMSGVKGRGHVAAGTV